MEDKDNKFDPSEGYEIFIPEEKADEPAPDPVGEPLVYVGPGFATRS